MPIFHESTSVQFRVAHTVTIADCMNLKIPSNKFWQHFTQKGTCSFILFFMVDDNQTWHLFPIKNIWSFFTAVLRISIWYMYIYRDCKLAVLNDLIKFLHILRANTTQLNDHVIVITALIISSLPDPCTHYIVLLGPTWIWGPICLISYF